MHMRGLVNAISTHRTRGSDNLHCEVRHAVTKQEVEKRAEMLYLEPLGQGIPFRVGQLELEPLAREEFE